MTSARGSKRTQAERVARGLEQRGKLGLTQVDALGPHTFDGGPPITRLASRISDLKAAGWRITKAGRRNRCDIYLLVARPGQQATTPDAHAVELGPLTLLPPQAGAVTRSVYDPAVEAA